MKRFRFSRWLLKIGILSLLLSGCGTTRLTDTLRTGTEQLLVSNAVDQAVSQLDFHPLAGKTVYLDGQYLEGVIDRGYLTSSLRQHLVASGCHLQEDRTKANYVVEVRSGGVGTNRSALLVGIPQMNVPTFVPGQPSSIPEIPFAKKTDQEGIAKIAVFAYNRLSGEPIWQSGVVQAISTSKDTWVLGAGPFQQGTIRKGLEFAGQPISIPTFNLVSPSEEGPASPVIPVTQAASWMESDSKAGVAESTVAENQASNNSKVSLRSAHFLGSDGRVDGGPNTQDGKGEPGTKGSSTPGATNSGGQVETEPTNVFNSGIGSGKPPSPQEGDWNRLLHPGPADKQKGSGR
jgi:hypothetical protein